MPLRCPLCSLRSLSPFVLLSLAVITYIRLTQRGDDVKAAEETRIWQRTGAQGAWKQVHFHRSGL
jgi:hypothetical protein